MKFVTTFPRNSMTVKDWVTLSYFKLKGTS